MARSGGTGPRGGVAALVTGTAAALVAASGFRPLTRRFPAAVAGSVPSFLAAELSRPTMVATLAVAVLAWRRGAAASPAGRVGLGLAGSAVGALALLDRSARDVDSVLATSLAAGLGHGVVLPPGGVRWRGWWAGRRYRSARDVSYGQHGGANTLDVWRRPDLPTTGRAPVFVQIHGGAWSSGRKEDEARPLMTHLTARGWVCVAVNYRLGPHDRWPAQIVDVHRALAWVHAHIGDHGGDPGFVAVGGGSAGAHLAALAALTADDPRWAPPEGGDRSVQAAVTSYGIYDLTTDDGSGTLDELLEDTMMPTALDADARPWAAASPTHRVHPGAPPFLVLHGTGDALVVTAQSRAFVRRLRAVSRAPVVYAELPHAQHAFDVVPSPRTMRVVRAVEVFLEAVAARRSTPAPR